MELISIFSDFSESFKCHIARIKNGLAKRTIKLYTGNNPVITPKIITPYVSIGKIKNVLTVFDFPKIIIKVLRPFSLSIS